MSSKSEIFKTAVSWGVGLTLSAPFVFLAAESAYHKELEKKRADDWEERQEDWATERENFTPTKYEPDPYDFTG